MREYSESLHGDGAAIFLLHGVIRQRRHAIRNYTDKHLALDRFVAVLRDLCSHGTPVSMAEIARGLGDGRLPQRAFAVTFDDGFENNYSVAAPVLAELGVPATFYVTTGFIESNGSSWIDMIEYAVALADGFELTLPHSGLRRAYRTADEKVGLLEEIRRVVKGEPRIDPYQFAGEVWRQLGVATMHPDPDLDQKMSWTQLRELSRHPLFAVGGHGHTHRILEYLGSSELEEEIRFSLERLRTNLGTQTKHYSYPEGRTYCFSQRVIDALRRSGIVCAVSAEEGINRPGDDLFRLARIMVT